MKEHIQPSFLTDPDGKITLQENQIIALKRSVDSGRDSLYPIACDLRLTNLLDNIPVSDALAYIPEIEIAISELDFPRLKDLLTAAEQLREPRSFHEWLKNQTDSLAAIWPSEMVYLLQNLKIPYEYPGQRFQQGSPGRDEITLVKGMKPKLIIDTLGSEKSIQMITYKLENDPFVASSLLTAHTDQCASLYGVGVCVNGKVQAAFPCDINSGETTPYSLPSYDALTSYPQLTTWQGIASLSTMNQVRLFNRFCPYPEIWLHQPVQLEAVFIRPYPALVTRNQQKRYYAEEDRGRALAAVILARRLNLPIRILA